MKKHLSTRVLSIMLAVCMLFSMLSVGMAGALDVTGDYADVNGGAAYYRYFIPGQYLRQWYCNGDVPGQGLDYHWTVYKNIWNGTLGHSLNKASALNGISGGVSTHFGTDQKTDPFYLYQYDLDGKQILFGKYYGVAGNTSYQMIISVPASDTYTVKANMYYGLGAQADVVDYWIAPDDAEDPMAEEYYVGALTGIKNGGTLDVLKFGEVATIDLNAGEYVVTGKVNGAGAIYGGSIELWGTMEPSVVTLTADSTFMNEEGLVEVPAGDVDGVWLPIYGEDSMFGELDLIDYDAPTYARVDCHSDMIDATYADGMVNITASYIGDKDTTSATLYMEVGGNSAWVEIPVKVVPGTVKILTLGHTGKTDKMMANVGSTNVTLTAKVDGVDTEIVAEDVIDVEIVDAEGNVASGVVATIDGANINFKATEAGNYTAKVTATIAGVSTTAAYEIPLNVSAFSLNFNLMKLGSKLTTNSSGWWMKEIFDEYADSWTGGTSDVNADVYSDGWKIGAKGDAAGEWLWTSSAVALGAYFATAGSWNSVDVFVPVSGNYDITSVHSVWATGGQIDYYLAPIGAANPIADEYKINATAINHKASAISEVSEVIGNIDVAAGEYTLVIKSSDGAACGVFQKAINFVLNGEATGTKVYIDAPVDYVHEWSDFTYTYWAPAAYILPTFLRDTNKITWSSSDKKVFTVAPSSAITLVGEGFAELIATATDGSTASIPVIVGGPNYDFGIADAAIAAYNAGKANTYLDMHGWMESDYSAAAAVADDPWFVKASTCDYTGAAEGAYYLGCFWATSVRDNGVTTAYGTEAAYTQLQIKIDAAGDYRIVTPVDKNSVAWAPFAFYLAPVDAADPTAEEYLVSKQTSRMSGNKQTPTALGDVSLEAGEYIVTYKKLPSGNRSVSTASVGGFDYLMLNNLRFYAVPEVAAPEVGLNTVNGAQIRTTGTQGLRFISTIDKTSADYDRVVEFGHIMIPEASMEGDYTRLVLDGVMPNGHKVGKSQALNLYSDTDTATTFTTVITTSNVKNYTRDYAVRAYAILDDGTVLYGEQITVRSIYGVAERGLENPELPDFEREIYEGIMDAVANL